MPLTITNTLTKTKEIFKPIHKNKVSMYVCGPTVYDEPHIGHARAAFIFDVIKRYLEYLGFKVIYVRNITDVDDKIIEKAKILSEEGFDILKATIEVADKYLLRYYEDMDSLGIRRPDFEPKATEFIPKMIELIEQIVEKGFAYTKGGDIYFDVKKFASYGKLSGQDIKSMLGGTREIKGESKVNKLDFALWKSSKPNEPAWKSPWGMGRPGWHIECSAMSLSIFKGPFDIHGGGVDLVFPHHENEIAQSESYLGKKAINYWLHNGLVTINGEKMAKSLGNFVSIKNFLSKYPDPDMLKLFFLKAHYRSPVDYTAAKIEEAWKIKHELTNFIEMADELKDKYKRESGKEIAKATSFKQAKILKENFFKAMDDDFNTPMAIGVIFKEGVNYAKRLIAELSKKSDLDKKLIENVLGLKDAILELTAIFGIDIKPKEISVSFEKEITAKIALRNDARKKGDFKKADEIRNELEKIGIILEDSKLGTIWKRKF